MFQHLYVVLSKGGLDFYASREAYNDGSDRLSRVTLKVMKISTESKYFNPETPQVIPFICLTYCTRFLSHFSRSLTQRIES